MNKKKLSVVMAGAMLASSVSPVLAATESTASAAELGMLVQKVRTQLTSKDLQMKQMQIKLEMV